MIYVYAGLASVLLLSGSVFGGYMYGKADARAECRDAQLEAVVAGLQSDLTTARTGAAIAGLARQDQAIRIEITGTEARTAREVITHAVLVEPLAADCRVPTSVHAALSRQVGAARDRLQRAADSDAR